MSSKSFKAPCPVIQLRQHTFSRPWRQPKLIYGVWTTGLLTAVFFATLYLAPFVYAVDITNPIKATTFEALVEAIAKAVGEIAILLGGVAIIFTGFKFLTAGLAGDTKALADARKMFLWVLIGTAITVGATVLARVVVNTVKNLGS